MPPDPAQAILDLPSEVPAFVGALVSAVLPSVYGLLLAGLVVTLGVALIRRAV